VQVQWAVTKVIGGAEESTHATQTKGDCKPRTNIFTDAKALNSAKKEVNRAKSIIHMHRMKSQFVLQILGV